MWRNENDVIPPYGQNVLLLHEAPIKGYFHIKSAELLLGNYPYWRMSEGDIKRVGFGKLWMFAGDIPLPDGFTRSDPDPNGYVYIHRHPNNQEPRND